MRDTDRLIDDLAREAKPVKPLAAPLARAATLLAGLLAVMAAFAAFGGHVNETLARLADIPFTLELVGALIAGAGAIVAAVVLSVPGRARSWAYLPVPGLLMWIASGGVECYRQVADGYVATSMFASSDCFKFIVAIGLPTAAATYLYLRRHLSVDTVRVTTLAALGSALLAASLLQFIHAHGTNPVDFATHIVAVMLLVLAAAAAARFERR